MSLCTNRCFRLRRCFSGASMRTSPWYGHVTVIIDSIPRLCVPLRQVQVPVQEFESAFPPDGMAAIEVLDFCLVSQVELRVQPADLGVFVRHPLILPDPIVMPALHHERTRH